MSNETEGTEETEEWEFGIEELRTEIKEVKKVPWPIKEQLLKICDVLDKMESYYDSLIELELKLQTETFKDYLKTHRHLPDGTVVKTV